MSSTGVSVGTIFALIYLAGMSRPWPLVTYIKNNHTENITHDGNESSKVESGRQERVLNFISLPVSVECVSDDGRRSGLCLNVYECKILNGVSQGECALGFGVCCVCFMIFRTPNVWDPSSAVVVNEVTGSCGEVATSNLTYFVNREFPGLSSEPELCEFTIHKSSPQISQLRLDFVHFSLAQPNRKTGVCENDVMRIESHEEEDEEEGFILCGLNNGQHIYYDVEDLKEPIKIIMNLTKEPFDRIWEIKITQIEFQNKAPPGCLQFYTTPTGVIQTMNFAENGRHLANQDYTICVRQEEGMCSIVYEPCDENSFKIGPPIGGQNTDEGSGYGAMEDWTDECSDKVLMPCDSEEFITENHRIPGVCDLLHCGSSFCPDDEFPCRIESSTIPFNIRIQFGDAIEGESPEDNLGMCLKYEQIDCF